jgi:hypothetical protein
MKPHLCANLPFVLAVPALSAGSPAVATRHGGTVGCGDTITKSTRLTANLVDCPTVGLVIAADGITLDLNGHRVDGGAAGDDVGIDVEGHRV